MVSDIKEKNNPCLFFSSPFFFQQKAISKNNKEERGPLSATSHYDSSSFSEQTLQ